MWLLTLSLTVLILPFVQCEPLVGESTDMSYRLSGKIIPDDYSVRLIFPDSVFNEGTTVFSGVVNITFQVTETVDLIDIHTPSGYGAIEVRLNATDGQLSVNSTNRNVTTSILSIVLNDRLIPNESYRLIMEFVAELEPVYMTGAYLSQYKTASGENKRIIITQFAPDYARKAFPCFDEPEYKATFQLEIIHPELLSALSNTAPISNVTYNATHRVTLFEKTPTISTYLIAFVISDFTCSGWEGDDVENQHEVCSRIDMAQDRTYAINWGPQIINTLKNLTGIDYGQSLSKMQQVAIPDFYFGAMENWGLVTYRESALLYNELESPISSLKYTTTVIAHELAHQWFGNLITTKWWNTIFLNEGFATYYGYFGPASIPETETEWELSKQFVVDQQQYIFLVDGLNSSTALSSPASTSTQIFNKFNRLSYNKGASVIRMVHNFLGHENFQDGIHRYLTQNQYKSVQPWNLWEALQEFTPEGALPPGITLENLMDSWVNKSGYPVVTVTASGNDVLVSQERFLYEGTDDTQWYVPISYTTHNDNSTAFDVVSPKSWLIPGNFILKLPNVLENDGWIILNNQESAYYRVNYDKVLWARIANILRTDHTKIHVINRAQIVDDSINLARAGRLTYSETFDIISYLRNETDYYPIYAALYGFIYLTSTYGENSDIGTELNKLQLELLERVKDGISFETNVTHQIDTLKLVMVLSTLCRLEEANCVSQANNMFAEFKAGQRLDANYKATVYCTALRHSNDSYNDWNFLWDRFLSTKIPTEEGIILSTLGCVRNESLLEHYLEQTLNESLGIRAQDLSRVWTSVITSNPIGVNVSLKFYIKNHARIISRYSSLATVLISAASRITESNQIELLEEFLRTNLTTYVKAVTEAAIKTGKVNMEWASVKNNELKGYFDGRSGSDGNVARGLLVIVILLIVILLW